MAGEAVRSESQTDVRITIDLITAVANVAKGDVEVREDVVGYALGDARAGDGNYSTTYSMCFDDPSCVVPKAAVAITAGERAFWNGTAFTNVEADNIAAGWFLENAAGGTATVKMCLHNELDAESY